MLHHRTVDVPCPSEEGEEQHSLWGDLVRRQRRCQRWQTRKEQSRKEPKALCSIKIILCSPGERLRDQLTGEHLKSRSGCSQGGNFVSKLPERPKDDDQALPAAASDA